ncbi:unnamed protein product [Arctogadus glacialis]
MELRQVSSTQQEGLGTLVSPDGAQTSVLHPAGRRLVGDENAGNNVLSGDIITDRLMAVLVSSLHPCPDPSLHPPPTLPCPSLSVPLSVPLSSCESILASAQRGVVHILDVGDQSVLLTSKHHTYLSAAMATYWSAGLHSLLTWRAAPEV